MNLFVIRHARAVDRSEPIEDAWRPLSARGRREALEVGKALREQEVVLDAIVTSPLVRAVETAELVAVGLKFEGALDVAPELGVGRHPQAVVEEVILPRADLAAVAVVGHEPQLSELVAALLRTSVPSLAKGAAVRLAWEGIDAPARFKWVVKPGLAKPSKHLLELG
jgi:phosphohistidine phosphatase